MELAIPVALAIGALIAVVVLMALGLRRRRARATGVADASPVQREGHGRAPRVPGRTPAGAPDKPVGKAVLAGADLDDLLESRMLRKLVANADARGQHDEAVQAIARLTGLGAADAQRFIDTLRQRGHDDK